jgi:hypothetical protein
MTDSQRKQYEEAKRKPKRQLSDEEKKIFDAIKQSFPMTSDDAAMDYAIQGGVNFQFISK